MPEQAGLEARNVAGAMTSMRIDELISNLAIGIAQGQLQLDQVCMQIAKFMGDAQVAFGKRAGSDEPDLLSLIELGFTPNFYQFVDTILEVRVAVSSQYEEKREYDTSDTQMQQSEYQSQSQYEASQSSAYSGFNYGSYGYGYSSGGWGWAGWGGGSGGYGSSYSGAGSSQYSGASSMKNKSIALTTVDAKYASTYNYAVEGSSLIKTKIVPVPPPQVFEEIVRAKLKERREWEQHMRWTDQARAILTGVSNFVDTILKEDGELDTAISTFSKTNAGNVNNAITLLQEDYNRMSTDHWAVISGSVALRLAADNSFKTIAAHAQNLVAAFSGETSPDTSEIDDIIADLKTGLGSFKGSVVEILKKIPAAAQTATGTN